MYQGRTQHRLFEPLRRLARHQGASRLGSPRWLGGLLALLILVVIANQNTSNTGSDPRGTLLVSQAILQHGSIRLDAYGQPLLERYGYVIQRKDGHYYHYFPLGTALLSTPVVAIANGLGLDMTRDEPRVQMLLTALAALLIAWLLYRTARLYLPPLASGLLTGLCWFGSALASTLGTALWSHNFAFVLSSAAIFLVLRGPSPHRWTRALLIGLCLFLAYLCRPTLALLAPFLLCYYLFEDKKAALLAGATLGLLLLGFMGWSLTEFAQVLPDYYLPRRLESPELQTALQGNLFSPARGLLVYSPFLVVSLCLTVLLAPRNKTLARLSLISLAWPIVHLLSISQFPHWWAGWSFGARLMVDALPGLFVGLFGALAALHHGSMGKTLACATLLVSGLFALGVNTYQGLFNPYAMRWNSEPNVDENPDYLFDWRYPQFLHSASRHAARLAEFRRRQLPPFSGRLEIPYDSAQASFDSFHGLENGFRWSAGQDAALTLVLEPGSLRGEARLRADFLGNQRLTIALNGRQVFQGLLHGGERDIRFEFSPDWLRPGLNTFAFHLPDARTPASEDPRILAMAFRKLSLK